MVLIVYYDGTTKEEIKRIFKEFKKEEERRNQDNRRDNLETQKINEVDR